MSSRPRLVVDLEPHQEIVAGEFYPCKPDIFKATYEKVADDAC